MQDTGCTLFLYFIVSAFRFMICLVSCFCVRHWLYTIFILHHASLWFYKLLSLAFVQDTGCTLILCYIVSAFDVIIYFVSCFCTRHWLYTIFILHCVSLWFYNLLCFLFSCKTLYWLYTTLYYIVSAFDFIFGSQMPFECTTHIRPPFLSVCPLQRVPQGGSVFPCSL